MCWEKEESCLCETQSSEGEMQDGRRVFVKHTVVFPVFYYGIWYQMISSPWFIIIVCFGLGKQNIPSRRIQMQNQVPVETKTPESQNL